jgi:hypothetical protein
MTSPYAREGYLKKRKEVIGGICKSGSLVQAEAQWQIGRLNQE